MSDIPTLVQQHRKIVNPEVCDVLNRETRVLYPDGSSEVITGFYTEVPNRLRNLLYGWLAAHIDAVRREDASSLSVSVDATLGDHEKRIATLEQRVNRELP